MSLSEFHFSPRRELGKTGHKATILGIGDLADRSVPLNECVKTIRRALRAGLNLIDTAPSYEDGYSEEIVGAALKGRRDGIFVISKIDYFDKPVTPQAEESLCRLKMDHVDAFLFHGVSSMEDWRHISSKGGPMAELKRCAAQGKTRFCGISAHHPDVLESAILSGLCDIVMFPVGPYCDERYITKILPLAKKKKVGSVGIKTFAAGKLLCDTTGYGNPLTKRPRRKLSSGGIDDNSEPRLPRLTVEECVRYTLTCDPDVALLGMSFENEQKVAFKAATNFKPFTLAEMEDIRKRAAEAVAGKGPCWWNPEE